LIHRTTTIEIFDIFTCPACHETTLIRYSTLGNEDVDDWQDDPERELYRDYDRAVLHAPSKSVHRAVPRSIADIKNQARSVLYKSPRASFILCRAVLEEVCDSFNIPSEGSTEKGKVYFIGLKERLIRLFKQEQMSSDLVDIMQGIRELGNVRNSLQSSGFSKAGCN
jgi:hypothetical protein